MEQRKVNKWKAVFDPLQNGCPNGGYWIKEDTKTETPVGSVPMPFGGAESGIERQKFNVRLVTSAPDLLEKLIETQRIVILWTEKFKKVGGVSPSSEKCISDNKELINWIFNSKD